MILLSKHCRFGHTSRDCTAPKVTLAHPLSWPIHFLGVLANDFAISRTGPRSNATTVVRWGTLSSAARSRSRKRQVGLWRTMESLEARLAVEAGSSQL